MPLGAGRCFCCVANEKGFKATVYYDIITGIFILTLPRAIGAYNQMNRGYTVITSYSKLRLLNWFLLFLAFLISLIVFSNSIVQDEDVVLDITAKSTT